MIDSDAIIFCLQWCSAVYITFKYQGSTAVVLLCPLVIRRTRMFLNILSKIQCVTLRFFFLGFILDISRNCDLVINAREHRKQAKKANLIFAISWKSGTSCYNGQKIIPSQPEIICSKLAIETLEQRCEICSKLTIKTPKRRHCLYS